MKNKALQLHDHFGDQMIINLNRRMCQKVASELIDWKTEIAGCIYNKGNQMITVDSGAFTNFIGGVIQKLGVTIVLGSSVKSFSKHANRVNAVKLEDGTQIQVDKLIICAGIQTRQFGKELGWKVPIWPVKGYTFNAFTNSEISKSFKVNGIYLAKIPGAIRVSSMAVFCTPKDVGVDYRHMEGIQKKFVEATGYQEATFQNQWGCMRPVSCDDMPIIGKFPGYDNVYINAGHGSRGLQQSFVSAEMVSSIVKGESPVFDPVPFKPTRFYY